MKNFIDNKCKRDLNRPICLRCGSKNMYKAATWPDDIYRCRDCEKRKRERDNQFN